MSLSLPESLRLLLPDGTIKRILLEDYLRGVVAAALPADAPLEAMKALAVAARTFAANTHRHLEQSADVCTTRHCQQWNERANPRAARAVMETRGIVVCFNGELIEAFYFEHCDGKTRAAKGVLMGAPAYLKSVTCPCGFASMKGHGIGMCLRGMSAMARLGEHYDRILGHYYSGIALQELVIDETTRESEASNVKRDAASVERETSSIKRQTISRPVPTVKPTARVEPAKTKTETPPSVPSAEPEKPARKTIAPRRSARQKIEQQAPPAPAATSEPMPPAAESSVTLADAHSPEQDDLLLFLTVEDITPSVNNRPQTIDNRPPIVQEMVEPPSDVRRPPSPFAAPPPPSMPEDLSEPLDLQAFAAPPMSMPEDLPRASELDFLAPPSSLPEDVMGAPPDEFLGAAHSVEPNLGEFMPPIEKFYTPLDAPPSMPEAMPSFNGEGADETPFAWVPPPPLQENAYGVKPPQVLMDVLPGPRVIAGNLPKAGMMVTIRDGRGNSIVTVSGAAKQYGSGGFEAPLTDDGAYQVEFNGTELDVKLENETVFIYYN